MTTPGRVHLLASLVLLASLAGVGYANAGFFGTPTGGFGLSAPAPQPVTGTLASPSGGGSSIGR